MKKVCYILIPFFMINCNLNENITYSNNPYNLIFSKLRNLQVTDTVLVSSKIDAYTYVKELDTIDNPYGKILSEIVLLNQFEKQNNTRIIQVIKKKKINQLVFKDSLLTKEVNLLDRLIDEKDMITFKGQYYGFSMSVKVGIKKAVSKVTKIQSYSLGLKHIGWRIYKDSVYEIENFIK